MSTTAAFLQSHANSGTPHTLSSVQISLTVLFTFLKVLTRRICVTIKSFFFNDHFLYSHDLNVRFSGDIVRRNEMLVPSWGQRDMPKHNFSKTSGGEV